VVHYEKVSRRRTAVYGCQSLLGVLLPRRTKQISSVGSAVGRSSADCHRQLRHCEASSRNQVARMPVVQAAHECRLNAPIAENVCERQAAHNMTGAEDKGGVNAEYSIHNCDRGC
jgi:hypothetical protein